MDEAAVAAWTEALPKIGEDERWVNQTISLGSIPKMLSPEDTVAFVENQYNTFSGLVDKLGLQID